MKRDMELVRRILFAIESEYKGVSICNLSVPEYDLVTIAEHCKIMYEKGLINEYKPVQADGTPVLAFWVGNLTWEGYDFLDKIREDTVWNKTKGFIKDKALPMTLDVIKEIAAAVISETLKGALAGML